MPKRVTSQLMKLLSSRPQEPTYSVEQAEQLIGGMQLSDTGSD